MQYKFRWFYAVASACVIFLLAMILDVLPRWQNIQSTQQEEKQLQAKIATMPKTRSTFAPTLSAESGYLVPIIMSLAKQHEIAISKLIESGQQRIHLIAQGQYENMSRFIILSLSNGTFDNFTFQAVNNKEVRLTAELIPWQAPGSHHTFTSLSIIANPFCWQTPEINNTIKITEQKIDLPNANLGEAILLLAKVLNRNVIVSPQIVGRVTLHLYHAQPAKVFDMLLDANGLGKWEQGGIWYVAPRDELIKRKQQEVKWQTLSYQAAELLTESWQIHYAKAVDIARLLQNGKTSLLSVRGQVRVDERTNFICVQDVAERLSVIRQLIAKLDRPTEQVRIEARLASVDSDFERELGVDFTVKANGMQEAAQGRYSIAAVRLPDGSQLDIKLAALESAGHANLISSPSLYTANQQTATIEAGEEVPYQEVSESGGTAVTFKKAVLGLKVTPQILPGGFVLLQLRISQDRPSSHMVQGMPTISTRQIVTSVLVKGGQTAVLGGIYENQDEKAVRRIPLLADIPLIGELFTLKASRQSKRELLIFVTPKIMTQLP